GSDVAAGPAAVESFPVRLIAWFPPLMWESTVRGGLSGVVLILALAALAALAAFAVRDLRRLSAVDRPAAAAVVVTAFALVVLGAGLGALNGDVQQIVAAGRWGQGWRDSAVTMPAGALLLAGAGHLFRPRRAMPAVLVLLLAAGATGTAVVNKR